MEVTLWIALGFLAAASVMKSRLFAGSGGVFLSLYWISQPQAYIGIRDYFNAFLAAMAAIVSFLLAWHFLKNVSKNLL